MEIFEDNFLLCGFAPGFVNTKKKGCTRLAAASEKVYQLLAHGRWFSPGTPASSTKMIEEIRRHTAESSQYNSFKIRSKLEEK
jgi:hypothetical protein